ncbi:carboxypeptidase B-like [Branchiostoma floridae]|uniref:Carboxypeptidase B-like n=1 Tax=Branchiostoma floridae TaxID=7739 RepID=A0A9J7HID2_BRAFL|nr:carboxypeptidase B-like [Branchiostoma floridae]
MCLKLILISASILSVVAPSSVHERDEVLRIFPRNAEDVRFLTTMDEEQGLSLDFWKFPSGPDNIADVHVQKAHLPLVKDALKRQGIPFNVLVDDVGEALHQHMRTNRMSRALSRMRRDENFDFSVYHTYKEITDHMRHLATNYPDIASIMSVAGTYEGRSIMTIKLGKPFSNGTVKPAFWIDGAIHSREWIVPATIIYAVDRLVRQYGSDPTVTRILDGLDLYVTPVFNVDGYVYTWQSDDTRLWRKNRAPQAGPCVGVDMNRNWDSHWSEGGSSHDPCNWAYHGTAPFSEQETREISTFIWENRRDIRAYIAFHSYSQVWMAPWGHSYNRPPGDAGAQDALGRLAVETIKSVHGVDYVAGRAMETLYQVSGDSQDWTYDKAGIKYSYIAELRDTGRYAFLLPPDQILPTAEEIFPSILTVGEWILDHY